MLVQEGAQDVCAAKGGEAGGGFTGGAYVYCSAAGAGAGGAVQEDGTGVVKGGGGGRSSGRQGFVCKQVVVCGAESGTSINMEVQASSLAHRLRGLRCEGAVYACLDMSFGGECAGPVPSLLLPLSLHLDHESRRGVAVTLRPPTLGTPSRERDNDQPPLLIVHLDENVPDGALLQIPPSTQGAQNDIGIGMCVRYVCLPPYTRTCVFMRAGMDVGVGMGMGLGVGLGVGLGHVCTHPH